MFLDNNKYTPEFEIINKRTEEDTGLRSCLLLNNEWAHYTKLENPDFFKLLKKIDNLMKKNFPNYIPKRTDLSEEDENVLGIYWKNKKTNINHNLHFIHWIKKFVVDINNKKVLIETKSSLRQYNNLDSPVLYLYTLYEDKNKLDRLRFVKVGLYNYYFFKNA